MNWRFLKKWKGQLGRELGVVGFEEFVVRVIFCKWDWAGEGGGGGECNDDVALSFLNGNSIILADSIIIIGGRYY